MAKIRGAAVLVTGASSGIGEATATALAGAGAAVALVARRADRLRELSGRIENTGTRALVVAADITQREQAANAVVFMVKQLRGGTHMEQIREAQERLQFAEGE